MKLIAIEEHFLTAEIRAAWATSAIGQEASFVNEAVLSREEKELFAHGNWERLTKAVDLGRAASS